jgi:hypothetical protein
VRRRVAQQGRRAGGGWGGVCVGLDRCASFFQGLCWMASLNISEREELKRRQLLREAGRGVLVGELNAEAWRQKADAGAAGNAQSAESWIGAVPPLLLGLGACAEGPCLTRTVLMSGLLLQHHWGFSTINEGPHVRGCSGHKTQNRML